MRRIALGLLVLLAGLLSACGPDSTSPPFRNSDLGTSLPTPPLDLPDLDGRRRQFSDFRGKLTIVFFGYTQCPDVCPTALAKYAALHQEAGLSPARLALVFVTLDPDRDTPQRLRDYLGWFHPDIVGLRGTPGETAEIARQFRLQAIRQPVPGELGYVIDHSAGAYVIDPTGKLRLHLGENANPADIRADLKRLLENR